jgi:hypothetical protein
MTVSVCHKTSYQRSSGFSSRRFMELRMEFHWPPRTSDDDVQEVRSRRTIGRIGKRPVSSSSVNVSCSTAPRTRAPSRFELHRILGQGNPASPFPHLPAAPWFSQIVSLSLCSLFLSFLFEPVGGMEPEAYVENPSDPFNFSLNRYAAGKQQRFCRSSAAARARSTFSTGKP